MYGKSILNLSCDQAEVWCLCPVRVCEFEFWVEISGCRIDVCGEPLSCEHTNRSMGRSPNETGHAKIEHPLIPPAHVEIPSSLCGTYGVLLYSGGSMFGLDSESKRAV